ncbi:MULTISPECIES: helix-turn-helix transcriptional regulator [unclassified Halanaerobium]|uniref:helix-turn-helix transcriptional regulator n=1 Tax=unclassified Halanaerobium TaxID=2641197 RepID=UPI000DF14FEE|nr:MULTISPECIES: helix-turn-helix transcriptional regulator [unclassified Halanaerobium]RCW41990.1 DNA-binding XRE family transcriptional regulator [Halanaerobium sp. MA284_MarDTE_T2]RCW79951.1 DNA-binding XRE family transcriptional regulator [Halanaerobium sp. DL-01]
MDRKTVVKNIKKLRKEYNLTQQQLAEKIGVGRSTIALVESGRTNPTEHLLHSISRELGVRLEWLKTAQGKIYKDNKQIVRECIDIIGDFEKAEEAFLKVMAEHFQTEESFDYDFYYSLIQLQKSYQNEDRNTKGYISILLKKTFSDYIE